MKFQSMKQLPRLFIEFEIPGLTLKRQKLDQLEQNLRCFQSSAAFSSFKVMSKSLADFCFDLHFTPLGVHFDVGFILSNCCGQSLAVKHLQNSMDYF